MIEEETKLKESLINVYIVLNNHKLQKKKEKSFLFNLNILELAESVKNSIIHFIKSYHIINNNIESNLDFKLSSDYESLLRREEAEIRKHIAEINTIKIQCDSLYSKIEQLEKEKIILIKGIVRKIFV